MSISGSSWKQRKNTKRKTRDFLKDLNSGDGIYPFAAVFVSSDFVLSGVLIPALLFDRSDRFMQSR